MATQDIVVSEKTTQELTNLSRDIAQLEVQARSVIAVVDAKKEARAAIFSVLCEAHGIDEEKATIDLESRILSIIEEKQDS